jgi:outer membrane protein insertion porin family
MSVSLSRRYLRSIRCVRYAVLMCMFTCGAIQAQEATPTKIVLDFEGNKIFSKQELAEAANECLARYSKSGHSDDPAQIEYCLHKVRLFLFGKGYLRATLGEPRRTQTEDGLQVVVPVDEGALYRVGELKVEGSKLFTPAQILEIVALKGGDIADGERISEALYDRVKNAYARFGYVQYTAEITPDFHLKAGASEGTVDFSVTIDEGHAFTIRSIKFEGNGNVPEDVLLREMLVRVGEVFNKEMFNESLKRISQTGEFEEMDVDKDVDYRVDNESTRLELIIHLKKKATTFE